MYYKYIINDISPTTLCNELSINEFEEILDYLDIEWTKEYSYKNGIREEVLYSLLSDHSVILHLDSSKIKKNYVEIEDTLSSDLRWKLIIEIFYKIFNKKYKPDNSRKIKYEKEFNNRSYNVNKGYNNIKLSQLRKLERKVRFLNKGEIKRLYNLIQKYKLNITNSLNNYMKN